VFWGLKSLYDWELPGAVAGAGSVAAIGYGAAARLPGHPHVLLPPPAARPAQVFVDQPSVPVTISILRGLRPHYERHHGVQVGAGRGGAKEVDDGAREGKGRRGRAYVFGKCPTRPAAQPQEPLRPATVCLGVTFAPCVRLARPPPQQWLFFGTWLLKRNQSVITPFGRVIEILC
jgi:hypothetical protein